MSGVNPKAIRAAMERLPKPTPEEEAELEAMSKQGTTPAPVGQVWICGACGKTSRTKYGFDAKSSRTDESGTRYASHGWDESCMMNSTLCIESSIIRDGHGRIIGAQAVENTNDTQ